MAKLPYSITQSAITVVIGNRPKVVAASSANFSKLADALRLPDHDVSLIGELVDMRLFLVRASHGQVQIADNEVRWRGERVRNVVAERLIDMLKLGQDLAPLANFLDRVMLNPLETAKDELFLWLESGAQPITPEGKILAFKKVGSDYMDIHSGTIRNAVGDAPSMPREKVDPDRNRTCSYGLHFCSFPYLRSAYSDNLRYRTMILEVDPADVVAIPSDYSNQKGRTWTYRVVGEVEDNERAATIFTDTPVVEVWVDDGQDGLDENDGMDEDDGLDGLDGQVTIDPAVPPLMFGHGGRSFLASEVRDLVTENGQRGFCRLTGVPRSTLYGWLKAIEARNA